MLCNDIRDAFSRLLACNFIKSNTTPWVFFMYFKLYKWYQIPQSITYNMFWEEKLSQAGQKNPKCWYKIFLHKSYGLKHETSTTAVDWHLKVKNKKCDVALIKNYCITVSMQKISSIHKLIDFRASWTKWPLPFLTRPTQKIIGILFAFLNLHHLAKNQFCSINSFLRYSQF